MINTIYGLAIHLAIHSVLSSELSIFLEHYRSVVNAADFTFSQ